VQKSSEILQESPLTVEHLANRAHVGLPFVFIQNQAAHSFIDVYEWQLK
jgi:hypothetical protein